MLTQFEHICLNAIVKDQDLSKKIVYNQECRKDILQVLSNSSGWHISRRWKPRKSTSSLFFPVLLRRRKHDTR